MTDASELNVIADSPFNSSIVYIGDFDDLLREQLVMMVEEKIKTVSTLIRALMDPAGSYSGLSSSGDVPVRVVDMFTNLRQKFEHFLWT